MTSISRIEVFLLQHSYENVQGFEETKVLGIFSSHEKAVEAQVRLSIKPGFSEKTDGFSIDKYIIDEALWAEGFVKANPQANQSL